MQMVHFRSKKGKKGKRVSYPLRAKRLIKKIDVIPPYITDKGFSMHLSKKEATQRLWHPDIKLTTSPQSSKVRLSDSVRLPDGSISTIAQLANEGRIEFKMVPNFGNRGVTKYFADLKGQDRTGWEIGELAYLSRTGGTITQFKSTESDIEDEMARYREMPEHLRRNYRICSKCGRVVKNYASGDRKPCPYCGRG